VRPTNGIYPWPSQGVILTIILSVKIVLTLRVKLPCPKCKILIVREILVLFFIVSEKNRKKDGRCIGAST
jgi:hypothetical protein